MDRFSYSRNGDNGHVDQNCQVRVQIPGIDTRNSKHVAYLIRVTNIATCQSWDVARRFSEFLHVRNALLAYFKSKDGAKCPGCVNYEKVLRLFEFPRKHVFTSVSPQVLNYRKVALRSFVALLASHTFTTKPKCPTCSGFAFTAVQDFLTTDLKSSSASTATGAAEAATSSSSSDAIRDSIDVRRFTERHPVSTLRTVDSNGRFTTSAVPSSARKHGYHAVTKPRPNAQQRPSALATATSKRAAGDDTDEPRSPPHSSTGSSSGSFGSAASPVAALQAAPAAGRRALPTIASVETADERDNGSFVSFTAGVTRAKRASSRTLSLVARRSSGAAVVIKQKSEKVKLNFLRRRTSSAAQRQSMVGNDADNDADVDDDGRDDEINMDFLQPAVAVAGH